MTKATFAEIVIALVFCVVAILLLNPMHFWMPSMAHMTMLGILAVAFAALLVFVLRERGGDEREDAHRALAGRVAFLAGSLVLIVGIALESLRGEPDRYLLLALLAMVIGKVGTRLWSELYQ